MPIVAPELPSGALDAIRRGLVATERFPRRRGGALSLTLPHPVYTVGLEPLAAGRGLTEAAELTGWRVLLEEDRKVVAAAEVPVADTGEPPAASITRGPLVDSTVEAVRTAERDERVASERFEARLLRAVALYVSALWLRGEQPERDVFIPVAPVPPPLRAGDAYDAARFERELQEMAKPVLSAYRSAARPDELGS